MEDRSARRATSSQADDAASSDEEDQQKDRRRRLTTGCVALVSFRSLLAQSRLSAVSALVAFAPKDGQGRRSAVVAFVVLHPETGDVSHELLPAPHLALLRSFLQYSGANKKELQQAALEAAKNAAIVRQRKDEVSVLLNYFLLSFDVALRPKKIFALA